MISQEDQYLIDFKEIKQIGRGGFGDIFLVERKIDRELLVAKKIFYGYAKKEFEYAM